MAGAVRKVNGVSISSISIHKREDWLYAPLEDRHIMDMLLKGPVDYSTFLLACLLGLGIWYLSPFLTGHLEPWDSESGYYGFSLATAGALTALLNPHRFWRWSIGIYLGQVIAFPLVGLGLPLPLSLIYLAGVTLVALAASALTALALALPKRWLGDRGTASWKSEYVFRGVVATAIVIAFGLMASQRFASITKAQSTSPATQEMQELFSLAAEEQDLDTLKQLSKNSSVAPELIRRLYSHASTIDSETPNTGYYSILANLASNPNTPADVLNELAQSSYAEIRATAAGHTHISLATLVTLARDPQRSVRTAVTLNPVLPQDILIELTHDKDKLVRSYAQTALRRRGESSN